jgi:hypothetical protein
MCQCEDRPCCGHDAEERADALYWEERAYFADDEYDAFDDYDDDEDNDEYDDDGDDRWALVSAGRGDDEDYHLDDRGFDNWIEE